MRKTQAMIEEILHRRHPEWPQDKRAYVAMRLSGDWC